MKALRWMLDGLGRRFMIWGVALRRSRRGCGSEDVLTRPASGGRHRPAVPVVSKDRTPAAESAEEPVEQAASSLRYDFAAHRPHSLPGKGGEPPAA